MTEPLRLLPQRIPFIDTRTGEISRDWYLFLQTLYERVGGADAPSNDDLEVDLFEDAGASEVVAAVHSVEGVVGQLPPLELPPAPDLQDPTNAELLAAYTELNKLVYDILVGTVNQQNAYIAELQKDIEIAQASVNQQGAHIAELLREIDAIKQATIGGQP